MKESRHDVSRRKSVCAATCAGSFGMVEEKGLKMFLRRLQEDQEDMLGLIKDRERARKRGLAEPALPVLRVPGPAVLWDVGQPPSPVGGPVTAPQSQEGPDGAAAHAAHPG